MKVYLEGPIYGVRPMPEKEGKPPQDKVDVISAGLYNTEVVGVLVPRGSCKEGQKYTGWVDVSIYQNRLSVREIERVASK